MSSVYSWRLYIVAPTCCAKSDRARGTKDRVALHVAGAFVVLAVRDHKRRIKQPAHRVVERLEGAERLVAALVRQDPQARAEEGR